MIDFMFLVDWIDDFVWGLCLVLVGNMVIDGLWIKVYDVILLMEMIDL